METAKNFNKIMHLSKAEQKVSDGAGRWDMYTYYSHQLCWAIVVFHVGGGTGH
jgi:hypothetical protein